MSIICEDIPNSEEVDKALFANIPSLVRVHYADESLITRIDANKLAPCVLPVFYKKIADAVKTFKVYKDDVWVTSFPKSGTTWTQEMVWLIVNNLDFDGAKKTRLQDRYGFLELSVILSDLKLNDANKSSVKTTEDMARPRFIKSHLPIGLLPIQLLTVQPKLVYVIRNPKDAAISYYHHFRNLHRYKRNLEEFLDTFLKDLVCWSPYCDHVLGYWKLRNNPNILLVTYEDMSKDLKSVLRNVAKFFNKTYTDDQFNRLAKHLTFDEMKNNSSVNFEDSLERVEKQYGAKRVNPNFRFLRRGQVNSAKDEMPVEYQKKFDDWMIEGFKGTDFKFNV